MHFALFLKSDLSNPNFVENSYFILFFLESYFFDVQSKFGCSVLLKQKG